MIITKEVQALNKEIRLVHEYMDKLREVIDRTENEYEVDRLMADLEANREYVDILHTRLSEISAQFMLAPCKKVTARMTNCYGNSIVGMGYEHYLTGSNLEEMKRDAIEVTSGRKLSVWVLDRITGEILAEIENGLVIFEA